MAGGCSRRERRLGDHLWLTAFGFQALAHNLVVPECTAICLFPVQSPDVYKSDGSLDRNVWSPMM